MGEIIFEKSRRNLKKIYNRINAPSNVSRFTKNEEVLVLAIGGYNRTFELLTEMGIGKDDIATFSNLNLSAAFLRETHLKKVLYIRKINYVTSAEKNSDFQKKILNLNIADGFEESLLIYKTAQRKIIQNKTEIDWIKPTVVVLDDQSLNLQFGGHRFKYQSEIGFVQIRNRNVPPFKILEEIKDVPENEKMKFALYQDRGADETQVLDALNRLRIDVHRQKGREYFMKPTEFKATVGSNDLANNLKEIPELGIHQLKSNKRIGMENSRWVVIPEMAFDFAGFDYKDEEDAFNEEIEKEAQSEEEFARQQEELLNSIILQEIPINVQVGYAGNMKLNPNVTLKEFMQEVDDIESEIGGVELLDSATTDQEYKHIKKQNLMYFIDGHFKDDKRSNDTYEGGRVLIPIDVDDAEYSLEELEEKLEEQNLFGIIYRTAKYYYDQSNRWRIILFADKAIDSVETYKSVVNGVAKMLNLEMDEASTKISQLMGYPLRSSDVTTVIGTKVNVDQFKPVERNISPNNNTNVVNFGKSNKSIIDFNHKQAQLLKEAVTTGIPEGRRNESYRQIVNYLRDTLNNNDMQQWHAEAQQYLDDLEKIMMANGIDSQKEREAIMR